MFNHRINKEQCLPSLFPLTLTVIAAVAEDPGLGKDPRTAPDPPPPPPLPQAAEDAALASASTSAMQSCTLPAAVVRAGTSSEARRNLPRFAHRLIDWGQYIGRGWKCRQRLNILSYQQMHACLSPRASRLLSMTLTPSPDTCPWPPPVSSRSHWPGTRPCQVRIGRGGRAVQSVME